MIAARKKREQVSKITAAGIAQPSDVLDTGQWIVRVVSYGELALSYGAADKRARSFLSTSKAFSSPPSATGLLGSSLICRILQNCP
jgi:hypothetical protein